MKKLTPAMQELLDAINSGVVVHYVPYSLGVASHYFRADNYKRCTKQAAALVERNLVSVVKMRYRRASIVSKKGGAT